MGEAASREGLVLAEQVRDALPDLQLVTHCGGGGMKAQFKRADRSGARYAMVLGDSELASETVVLKPLRADEPQTIVPREDLITVLTQRLPR
jgi:histidyl-tRNA synthetase